MVNLLVRSRVAKALWPRYDAGRGSSTDANCRRKSHIPGASFMVIMTVTSSPVLIVSGSANETNPACTGKAARAKLAIVAYFIVFD